MRAKHSHYRPVEGQHRDLLKEEKTTSLGCDRVWASANPFIDFGIGHQTDSHAVRAERSQKSWDLSSPMKPIDDIVAVDQVTHNSTGGRPAC